jgi:hypothetical protein
MRLAFPIDFVVDKELDSYDDCPIWVRLKIIQWEKECMDPNEPITKRLFKEVDGEYYVRLHYTYEDTHSTLEDYINIRVTRN